VTGPLFPGTDLVAVGWLKLIPGLPAGRIATKLPGDDALLRAPGFVRTMISGGTPARDMAIRSPVVTAECWTAPQAGSAKLPWGVANQLAEIIVAASYDRAFLYRHIDLTAVSAAYLPARVFTVIPLTEPRRVPDPSGFARFDVDLLINWRLDA
jgi:hypothetical protein